MFVAVSKGDKATGINGTHLREAIQVLHLVPVHVKDSTLPVAFAQSE